MRDVVVRLREWLEAHCAQQLGRLADGVPDVDLDATWPEGLRELHRWHGGTLPGQPPSTIIGRYGLVPRVQVDRIKAQLDRAYLRSELSSNAWNVAWVPVLASTTGDYVCWDPSGSFGGVAGQIVEYLHADHLRTILAPSFDAYLTAYVESLECGVWRYDDTHGFDDRGRFEPFLTEQASDYPRRAVDDDGRLQSPSSPIVTDADVVKPYSLATTYVIGDRVEHSQLGIGLVQAVDVTRVTIAFSVGTKTLVHARRERPEALGKAQPIDHAKRGPPKV
jgi:cell wall assembly regulator SMI1